MTEPTLEVRIWIDGSLVVDDRVTTWSTEGLGEKHTQLVAAADKLGKKWLVQVTDPDAPEDSRHIRFGSDRDGMVEPIELTGDPADALLDEGRRRFGYGQGNGGGS